MGLARYITCPGQYVNNSKKGFMNYTRGPAVNMAGGLAETTPKQTSSPPPPCIRYCIKAAKPLFSQLPGDKRTRLDAPLAVLLDKSFNDREQETDKRRARDIKRLGTTANNQSPHRASTKPVIISSCCVITCPLDSALLFSHPAQLLSSLPPSLQSAISKVTPAAIDVTVIPVAKRGNKKKGGEKKRK